MPVVTCPSCHKRYDPGVDEDLADRPPDTSLKVVCPSCGQWVRLPEQEPVDPPNVPADVLQAMTGQSRLVDDADDRPGPRPSDDEDDRPSRRPRRDWGEDEDDRPTRRRRRDDDLDRRAHWGGDRYGDERDDFDDSPGRRAGGGPGHGLAIASMIVGIISCVMAVPGICCILFTGVSVLTGVAAVILGFVARSQQVAPGMTMTGIITGFAGVGLSVIRLVLTVVVQIAGAFS